MNLACWVAACKRMEDDVEGRLSRVERSKVLLDAERDALLLLSRRDCAV